MGARSIFEMSSRRARVTETLRNTLAEMIARDVKDPAVRSAGMVTVRHVVLNRDMSVATVYVSFLGAEQNNAQLAIEGLWRAARFMRGPLARRMNLARAPELRFVQDTSYEFQMKLQGIIAEDASKSKEADSGNTIQEDGNIPRSVLACNSPQTDP